METFDDIQCEEYYEAFGTEQEAFALWMQAREQEELAEVNAELRTVVFV